MNEAFMMCSICYMHLDNEFFLLIVPSHSNIPECPPLTGKRKFLVTIIYFKLFVHFYRIEDYICDTKLLRSVFK